MVYLSDEEVARGLEAAGPEVADALHKWEAAWQAEGLPVAPLTADLIGPVFVPDPPEQLLPEDRRLKAAAPELWQLVFMTDVGLDVQSYEDEATAQASLAALGPDEYGEGGGLLIKGSDVVGERLFLKYMRREDYVEFLDRARTPLPPQEGGDPQEAVRRTALERLAGLAGLAPDLGRLRREYEAKGSEEPEVVYGRPSEALVEFARLFPEYVTLGGCIRGRVANAGDATPPTPPPER